jgi:hypothetical protein
MWTNLDSAKRHFAGYLVASYRGDFSDCALICTVFVPANILQMRQFLRVKPIASWFLGGASIVNVERSKASNTLTAHSEP